MPLVLAFDCEEPCVDSDGLEKFPNMLLNALPLLSLFPESALRERPPNLLPLSYSAASDITASASPAGDEDTAADEVLPNPNPVWPKLGVLDDANAPKPGAIADCCGKAVLLDEAPPNGVEGCPKDGTPKADVCANGLLLGSRCTASCAKLPNAEVPDDSAEACPKAEVGFPKPDDPNAEVAVGVCPKADVDGANASLPPSDDSEITMEFMSVDVDESPTGDIPG